jgi:excisionase family DNA binding protein
VATGAPYGAGPGQLDLTIADTGSVYCRRPALPTCWPRCRPRGGQAGPPLAVAPVERRFMGYEQAAASLGVSARTVRRMVSDGRLAVGAGRLILVSAIEEYVDARGFCGGAPSVSHSGWPPPE